MLYWIFATVCLTGLYSSLIERHWLDLRQVNRPIRDVPRSFQGLKIVLFSDIHLGFFYQPKHLTRLIDRIDQLEADVVCFTGDLLDDRSSLKVLEPSIELLARIQAPLGKFAVVGNHDYRAGIKETILGLEKAGFQVLKNEHVTLKKGEDHLTFVGVDDVLYGKPNLQLALEQSPKDGYRILLVHEPDFAHVPSPVPISLQLSGHSHGGQVRIPFWGPILTSKLGRKFPAGLNHGVNGPVYTTRGVGTTHLPIRFCCRPELTIITL